LKDKSPARDKQTTGGVKDITKFPQGKFDFLMDTLSTGPSHSAAVSVKRALYTWGHNDIGRLGLDPKESKRARKEPVIVSHIDEIMKKNK